MLSKNLIYAPEINVPSLIGLGFKPLMDGANFNQMKKICGIYKITCIITDKKYIGQSINILKRIIMYKNAKCKRQLLLLRSIRKYGWENHKFEIIHECNPSELNYWEKYYVDLFQTFNNKGGLNLRDGGGAVGKWSDCVKNKIKKSHKKRKFSKEMKDNMRKNHWSKQDDETIKKTIEKFKARTGINNPSFGKPQSKISKKRKSIALKGRIKSKEEIAKWRKSMEGYKHTDETKIKIGNSIRGKKHSKKTKEKISNGNSGKKRTPEQNKRQSEKMKGKPAWNKGKKGCFSKKTLIKMSKSAIKRYKKKKKK